MTTTDTSLTMPAAAEAASRYQRLRGHLAALKLHAAAEALAHRARRGRRRAAVADRGVGAAAGHRGRRHRGASRLAGRLRFASLPTPATLEGFDLDAAAGVDRNLIDELATCRYLESATNILLVGPPGAG